MLSSACGAAGAGVLGVAGVDFGACATEVGADGAGAGVGAGCATDFGGSFTAGADGAAGVVGVAGEDVVAFGAGATAGVPPWALLRSPSSFFCASVTGFGAVGSDSFLMTSSL